MKAVPPFRAWAASLPLTLGIPPIVWAIHFCLEDGPPERMKIPITALTGMALVHLIAYSLTGLPIFLICHRHPGTAIWRLPFALITGTGLGALALDILFRSLGLYAHWNPQIAALGAGYGLVTAIAAWRQRPQFPTP